MKRIPKIIFSYLVILILMLGGCSCSPKDSNKATSRNEILKNLPQATSSPLLVIEAEKVPIIEGMFERFSDPSASEKWAVRIPPRGDCIAIQTSSEELENKKPEGKITFGIQVKKAVSISIWARVKWSGTCSNSFTFELPGGIKQTITSSTYQTWIWIPVKKDYSLPEGTHHIIVLAREFDTMIDQILLTLDSNYIPQGIEHTTNLEALPFYEHTL